MDYQKQAEFQWRQWRMNELVTTAEQVQRLRKVFRLPPATDAQVKEIVGKLYWLDVVENFAGQMPGNNFKAYDGPTLYTEGK